KNAGSNAKSNQSASGLVVQEEGKFYYRHPDHIKEMGREVRINDTEQELTQKMTDGNSEVNPKPIAERFGRKTVAGIDVVTTKTGAKDFVTVAASFPIGNYFNAKGNEAIPSLTTALLSKGTTKKDKFQFSKELEKLGVSISVGAGAHKVDIGFKCLKKDLATVVDLLAEELRYPLFDTKEFDILKQQNIGNMQQGLSNPGTRGRIALSQILYPEGHPNYTKEIEQQLEDVKNATLEDIKRFHKEYFGPAGMHLVAVGDVDADVLYKALKKSFAGWKGGITNRVGFDQPQKVAGETKMVFIPEKPSAELFIGQYTGLTRTNPDYIPFFIGNYALGGGFSGRLMRTVRDEEGLTYNIRSQHTGHDFGVGGHWLINASFNPELFQKGLDATRAQLKKWWENGITEKELQDKKSNLTGSFKVGLSSTSGLANTLLTFLERGLEPSYVDEYSKKIEAVSLEQVNRAIKKYIDLDKLIIVKSGSLSKAESGKTE
ncbi:MAG: pitrilysin family protein, partial [Bacteroidota bacterium]